MKKHIDFQKAILNHLKSFPLCPTQIPCEAFPSDGFAVFPSSPGGNFHLDFSNLKVWTWPGGSSPVAEIPAASWWLSFNPFEKYATVKLDHFPKRGGKNVRFHHLVLTREVLIPHLHPFATCSFFVVWPSTHEKYYWVPIPPLLTY